MNPQPLRPMKPQDSAMLNDALSQPHLALRRLLLLAMLLATLPSATAARAAPPLSMPELRAELRTARASDPEAFTATQAIAARAAALDASKRGPLAVLTPQFAALGPRGLLPMLDILVNDRSLPEPLSASARTALTVGLLEAVGRLRDLRAWPAVLAMLDAAPAADAHVSAAAATALCQIDSERAAPLLIARHAASPSDGPRFVLGMAHCRCTPMAEHLSATLRRTLTPPLAGEASTPALTIALARSLGRLGADWAWQTSTLAGRKDREPIRDVIADTLVDAYLHSQAPAARPAIAKALLMLDHPRTAERLRTYRSNASESQAALIDGLLVQLSRNPLHR